MAEREKIVSLKQVSKAFPVGKNLLGRPDKFVHAVNNVSFDIYKGETFSVVGESGCGKSTTGRLLDHLITPDSGEIWFCGQEISHYTQAQMRPLRKDIQMIFQDPAGSLNPRMRVEDLVEEPLLIHTDLSREERMKIVHELLEIVGLSAKHAKRFPHEFSGGQRQRLTLARALVPQSDILIMDDSASALDYATDAKLRKAIQNMKRKPTVFIVSQRTSSIQDADSILVLDDGKIAGKGTHEELIASSDIYRETYETQFKKEEA